MELVIDANILFAALIKKSGTSEILFKHKIYAPEFIFEEFKKYKDELEYKVNYFRSVRLKIAKYYSDVRKNYPLVFVSLGLQIY